MIVDEIAVRDGAGGPALTATIRSDRGAFEPFEARYDVPGGDPSWLMATGDPFVVALLIPCDALGEDLRVEGPVSPRLLASTRRVLDILRSWSVTRFDWRDAWRGSGEPAVVSVAEERATPRADGVGLYLSLGVDSFHALLTNAGGPGRPTHLIFLDGFDLLPNDRIVFDRALEGVRAVAEATGTTPVVVRPNLRPLIERYTPWGISYGGWLLSVGIALGGVLGNVRVASANSYVNLSPEGLHALLDPLWSTEATEVHHVGAFASKGQKVLNVIARSPLALQHLRVCFAGPPKGLYNCGHCGKCMSAMVGLKAAGAPEPWPTFPTVPTFLDVLRHPSLGPGIDILRRSAPLLEQRGERAMAAAARFNVLRRKIQPRLRSLACKLAR